MNLQEITAGNERPITTGQLVLNSEKISYQRPYKNIAYNLMSVYLLTIMDEDFKEVNIIVSIHVKRANAIQYCMNQFVYVFPEVKVFSWTGHKLGRWEIDMMLQRGVPWINKEAMAEYFDC